MDFRSTFFLMGLILVVSSGHVLSENTTGKPGVNATVVPGTGLINLSVGSSGSDEALMNLAFDARAYALEDGKMAATSAFSDHATFIRNGMFVVAYDRKGVLLADPYQSDKIGTSFIVDDHDAGLIRQLSDIARTGGGILKPEGSGGVSYYSLDVDGSWWLAAVSGH